MENVNEKRLNEEYILNKTTDTNYRYFGNRKMILDLMKDNTPRTLKEIEEETGIGQTTASAILRQFRLEKYGSHTLSLTPSVDGNKYLLVLNDTKQ
jgi:predicted HTH transcriptional regulator|tara:strand:- start:575 stop:862 length:288 start_codon:yes stop_codon:yes gene_type:complete